MTVLSDQLHLHPDQLGAYWMPFTSNRHFKAAPRMLASADGMYYKTTEGKTLLTVEHDMGVVFGLADRIAVVVYGEVIAFDTPEAVRANPKVQEAYLGSVLAESQAAGA